MLRCDRKMPTAGAVSVKCSTSQASQRITRRSFRVNSGSRGHSDSGTRTPECRARCTPGRVKWSARHRARSRSIGSLEAPPNRVCRQDDPGPQRQRERGTPQDAAMEAGHENTRSIRASDHTSRNGSANTTASSRTRATGRVTPHRPGHAGGDQHVQFRR